MFSGSSHCWGWGYPVVHRSCERVLEGLRVTDAEECSAGGRPTFLEVPSATVRPSVRANVFCSRSRVGAREVRKSPCRSLAFPGTDPTF